MKKENKNGGLPLYNKRPNFAHVFIDANGHKFGVLIGRKQILQYTGANL